MRPELMNALAVAYLGDAVFEVYVREYLLTEKGIMKPHELQRASVKYVSAYAPCRLYEICPFSKFLHRRRSAFI